MLRKLMLVGLLAVLPACTVYMTPVVYTSPVVRYHHVPQYRHWSSMPPHYWYHRNRVDRHIHRQHRR